MAESVLPIAFEYSGIYLPSEFEKIDRNLVGIYAIYNEITIDNQKYAHWVYWGSGNILEGLRQFRTNPCYFRFMPQCFSYTTGFGDSKQKLNEIRSECGQLCK